MFIIIIILFYIWFFTLIDLIILIIFLLRAILCLSIICINLPIKGFFSISIIILMVLFLLLVLDSWSIFRFLHHINYFLNTLPCLFLHCWFPTLTHLFGYPRTRRNNTCSIRIGNIIIVGVLSRASVVWIWIAWHFCDYYMI